MPRRRKLIRIELDGPGLLDEIVAPRVKPAPAPPRPATKPKALKCAANKSEGLRFNEHLRVAKTLIGLDEAMSQLRPLICAKYAPGSQIASEVARAQRSLRRLRTLLDDEIQGQYPYRDKPGGVYFPSAKQDPEE